MSRKWLLLAFVILMGLLALWAVEQQRLFRIDVDRARMAIEQEAGDNLTATARAEN